jgi:hypothetical protein
MEEISFTETLYRKLHSNKVRHDEAFGPLTRDARVPASEQEIDAATDFFQDCMMTQYCTTDPPHRPSLGGLWSSPGHKLTFEKLIQRPALL